MSRKQIIAVDMDDVLAAENDSMRLFINQHYGLQLSKQDYTIEGEYWAYWEKVWKVDKEEGAIRYKAFLNSSFKGSEAVLPNAVKVIEDLKRDYDLVIVTSRDESFVNITHKWLERHFPKVFKSVEFVVLRSGNIKATKGLICRDIGASYLIDDNVGHCNAAIKEGVQALLFGDYGWNRKQDVLKGVTRVKNWQEIKEYFDEQRRY